MQFNRFYYRWRCEPWPKEIEYGCQTIFKCKRPHKKYDKTCEQWNEQRWKIEQKKKYSSSLKLNVTLKPLLQVKKKNINICI